jgi:hypothetical protein
MLMAGHLRAVGLTRLELVERLPRGVTVAQVTLDHFVMVRIHARQVVRAVRLTREMILSRTGACSLLARSCHSKSCKT